MFRSPALVTILVLAAACGTEPTPGPLTGRFGGRLSDGAEALLVATDTAVAVHLRCAVARFPAPLVADAAGRIAATGTLRTSDLFEGAVHLRGQVRGTSVQLELSDTVRTPRQRHGELRRGIEPDLDVPCLL